MSKKNKDITDLVNMLYEKQRYRCEGIPLSIDEITKAVELAVKKLKALNKKHLIPYEVTKGTNLPAGSKPLLKLIEDDLKEDHSPMPLKSMDWIVYEIGSNEIDDPNYIYNEKGELIHWDDLIVN